MAAWMSSQSTDDKLRGFTMCTPSVESQQLELNEYAGVNTSKSSQDKQNRMQSQDGLGLVAAQYWDEDGDDDEVNQETQNDDFPISQTPSEPQNEDKLDSPCLLEEKTPETLDQLKISDVEAASEARNQEETQTENELLPEKISTGEISRSASKLEAKRRVKKHQPLPDPEKARDLYDFDDAYLQSQPQDDDISLLPDVSKIVRSIELPSTQEPKESDQPMACIDIEETKTVVESPIEMECEDRTSPTDVETVAMPKPVDEPSSFNTPRVSKAGSTRKSSRKKRTPTLSAVASHVQGSLSSLLCGSERYVISGFGAKGNSLRSYMESHGATVVSYEELVLDPQDTVIIATPTALRRRAYFVALARGLPILHYDWLTESIRRREKLPYDGYV